MKPSEEPSNDPKNEGRPQPFAKFITMPDGWDLSGQPERSIQVRANAGDAAEQQCDATEEIASGDAPWQAQKFTKPRTIPTGWDTSALK